MPRRDRGAQCSVRASEGIRRKFFFSQKLKITCFSTLGKPRYEPCGGGSEGSRGSYGIINVIMLYFILKFCLFV